MAGKKSAKIVCLFLNAMQVQVVRRGNIYKKRKNNSEEEMNGNSEEVNGNENMELDMVFGNDEERMAMMEDIEEEWEGDEEIFLAE